MIEEKLTLLLLVAVIGIAAWIWRPEIKRFFKGDQDE